ncbi:hypothetical protein CPLU01_07825 [Colletotrichum plurivorum]|uniref:Mtf2-like C-terminal domain-containing protein n=1 Tax=Colletotrichum plurivorum TaxID=2175906 RepID=A0A8H6KDU5_9PEZI|nr:hypothetical protein CPLU01_07825 [Colletotrichum plurivorum]
MATTMTPFLYQTRTILRASVALRSFSTSTSRMHRLPGGRDNSIPFDWETPAEERADIPSGPDGEVKSTITPSERHVFRKIFENLARRPGRVPQSPADAADDSASPAAGSRDALLSQYPTSLRRAAEAALNMREAADGQTGIPFVSSPEFEQDTAMDEQAKMLRAARDELQGKEVARVQMLLDECSTDMEVWDVLEREVFSMVAKLGIAPEKANRRKEKDSEELAKEAEAAAELKRNPSLDMDSYGPLYSLHLLQGLKTLDGDLARPSPMALNVLPRIKKLGIASYVLGVSTPFYNELASIFWHRYGDTQEVLTLLDEMQYAGLSYNKQTLRLVDTIEMALDSFRDRQLGVFSKAVGTIPGYNTDAKAKVARYARRIRHITRQTEGSARY